MTDFILEILHKPTFLKHFENFWQTKETGFCPYLIGTCYAVFCLALQSYFRQDEEPSDLRGRTRELADLYRKRAAQCCLKSDITAPTRRAIEALLTCTICEYSRLSEAFIGQWLLLGILIRKSLHMGLHRDPDEFTSLSPFEKEMRRRIWAHIWQVDMMFSFQLGLPNAVNLFKSHVGPPINVFEEELTEDMKELPPARPPNEQTPIGFIIAKLNLSRAIADVVDYLNVRKGYSFEEVGELNQKLQDARAQIPEYLRVQPLENSITVPRSIRLQRLQLQSYYDKATCMLNRRFISMSEHIGPICMKPRAFCVESALNLLSIQEKFEIEQCMWWLFYFTKRDFLLAATILYLVLFTKQKERRQGFNPLSEADPKALDEEDVHISEVLDRSRAIWGRLEDESGEGRQACRMFDSMRRQLQSMDAETKTLQPLRMPSTQAPIDTSMTDLKLESMDLTETVAPPTIEGALGLDAQFADFDWSQWESTLQIPEMDGSLDGFWPGEVGLGDMTS
jgi:Fungal specific transcription factor domain